MLGNLAFGLLDVAADIPVGHIHKHVTGELSIFVAGFREGYAIVTVALIALLALIFTGLFGHFGGMVFGSPVKMSKWNSSRKNARCFTISSTNSPAARAYCSAR